jgi:hypothetical protein
MWAEKKFSKYFLRSDSFWNAAAISFNHSSGEKWVPLKGDEIAVISGFFAVHDIRSRFGMFVFVIKVLNTSSGIDFWTVRIILSFMCLNSGSWM